MSTPHNEAKVGEIAKIVLMSGDPLRAKYIADHYLENVQQFNKVRNMFGYTGYYKGKRISVMGHGMGMPSIAIYATELFQEYDVEIIIRIGTCGAMQKGIHLRDLIFVQAACTDSAFAKQYHLEGTYSAISNYQLLENAISKAKERNLTYHVGNVLSSDYFYKADGQDNLHWAKMGCLGVEMESYALLTIAAYYSKKALALMSVSDSLVTKEETSAKEREATLTSMIEVALEVAYDQM